jgi:hypothetical protein
LRDDHRPAPRLRTDQSAQPGAGLIDGRLAKPVIHGGESSFAPVDGDIRLRARTTLKRAVVRLRHRLPATGYDKLGDEEFVNTVYLQLLGREPDARGMESQLEALAEGYSRSEIILNLALSEEYVRRVLSNNSGIQDLTELRPDRYADDQELGNRRPRRVFLAEGPTDYDWLEQAILQYGYYEKPGVWSLSHDRDKDVMGEVIASFGPDATFEIGCANGTVMTALHRRGIESYGNDISTMALAAAPPEVRDRIVLGDLLDLDLPRQYPVVYGLDIFEHFNPNRLDLYLDKTVGLIEAGGYLFTNVPAFGDDPVYGPVLPFYLAGWEEEAAGGDIFRKLEVDAQGYPINGHLVWADWRWWTQRFEAHGLRREPDIERAIHAKYDHFFDVTSRARKAFFVFSKPVCTSQRDVIQRIQTVQAKALEGFMANI